MDELGGKAFWLNQCRGIWRGYWGFGCSLNTYKMPFPIGFLPVRWGVDGCIQNFSDLAGYFNYRL